MYSAQKVISKVFLKTTLKEDIVVFVNKFVSFLKNSIWLSNLMNDAHMILTSMIYVGYLPRVWWSFLKFSKKIVHSL